MSDFVHLHVHTEFSMLDGASRVDDLVDAIVGHGQPAVAMTDHGNMYGAVPFYKACTDKGIKPIVGTEFYMAKDNVDERPKKKGKSTDDSGGESEAGGKIYYHATALALNNTGYHNMMRLSSKAFLEGFWHKPRVDFDMLDGNVDGIVMTSGCLGGIVLQALMRGDYNEAVVTASKFQDILGKDNFFIELQDHGMPEQHQTNPDLIKLSSQLSAPLIATNDSHYTTHSDHLGHDALLCLQTGAKMADPDRFHFEGDQHYVKSSTEMRRLFREIPAACDNTLLVAERADLKLDFGQALLPQFPVPDGFIDEEDYLRHLVVEGAIQRYGSLNTEVTARLEYELEVICSMGFPGYFLIVWDLLRHARTTGIMIGPGRGSAAGCAVAYCLGIVDVDPLEHNLLFERFLNPARVSMPDIDIDIDRRYREHMINYCAEKYGSDRVAQIITFNRIKSRQAVRDASRVLDYPFSFGDRVAKALPPLLFGKDTPLKACLIQNDKHMDSYVQAGKFRAMYNNDPEVKKVVDIAMTLEDLRKSDGIHAAAVVIAPEPITNFVPIQRKPEKGKPIEEAPVVTQYEMHAVEDLGLLKMDFLGLRNLDVISDTIEMIKSRRGVDLDIKSVPLDDEAVFDLLRSGETMGVFQLEGQQMRHLLRDLSPETFEHLAAVLALYRPGPLAADMHVDYANRKNGRMPVEVFHPDAKELLADTYGLMVYQEQLMDVARKFAGYSLGDGYQLVKTCAKKLPEAMEKERDKFIPGCEQRGYSEELARNLFQTIEAFASYAFNRSHSVAYGMISYWTAYLKVHYTAEYMSALMTSVQNSHAKLSKYLIECKKLDLNVKLPDINVSERNFMPLSDDEIICGFLSIRGIGEAPSVAIIEERQANGPFKDFFDFQDRVPSQLINKTVTEGLIGSGSFDSLGHPRRGLAEMWPELQKQMKKDQLREEKYGKLQLFVVEPEVVTRGIPDIHYSNPELLSLEKQYLGVYMSNHPLADVQEELDSLVSDCIGDILDSDPDDLHPVRVAGIVTSIEEKWTKKGDLMKIFTLEDQTGEIRCVLFPRQTTKWGMDVVEDSILIIEGNPEEDTFASGFKILVDQCSVYQRSAVVSGDVHISVPSDYDIDELKEIISKSKGDYPVYLHYMGNVVKLPDEYKSSFSALKKEIGL